PGPPGGGDGQSRGDHHGRQHRASARGQPRDGDRDSGDRDDRQPGPHRSAEPIAASTRRAGLTSRAEYTDATGSAKPTTGAAGSAKPTTGAAGSAESAAAADEAAQGVVE